MARKPRSKVTGDDVQSEPRGICVAGARLLQRKGHAGIRELEAVLGGPCGLINPLECRVHAAAALERGWDLAERQALS